jgi:transposase InsO family protein
MRRGFLYLVAIMDWATRKVLGWRVAKPMNADFCVGALKEALARYSKPEIFNADQVVNLPVSRSQECYRQTISRSAWIVLAASSSSGCGGRSSTSPPT